MKSRNFIDFCKNAVGTVFLLAAAFFVCSTLVSMRAVLADPIAPIEDTSIYAPQATRAGNTSRASRANPRGTTSTVSRGTTSRATTSRGTTARTATATGVVGATTATTPSRAATATRSGATGTRTTMSRGTNSVATPTTSTRGVTARSTTPSNSRSATTARTVRARSGTTGATTARVSLQGAAIRGSKTTSGSTLLYSNSKLFTGNYSNIKDPTTGMISAEAYSNCMESYYTCMDEICTARNPAQGRCACAARTKSFATAEAALETANEELIKVSGELALLIATKGKDVTSAFTLTDAEKIMNCASYQEIKLSGDKTEMEKWCKNHLEYKLNGDKIDSSTCSLTNAPSYCTDGTFGNGFSLDNLNGSGSDILAQLRSMADAKDAAAKMKIADGQNLIDSVNNMLGAVSGLGVTDTLVSDDTNSLDSLANTWGYELFQYAHNNVCGRVLDSCFNGIYEACGKPPAGFHCADGSTSNCAYNFNSRISISKDGSDVEIADKDNTNNVGTAACFGYSGTTKDPYYDLRGPVADARRGIMQKYLLDVNASCDTYGDQLRATAQNVAYQKVAAQQALQQKRLEFAQEEEEKILADANAARSNFNQCLSDLLDCYEDKKGNKDWSAARIKTYCAQVANVPTCYQTMICEVNNNIKAVIDVQDTTRCNNSSDPEKNTCRNVVTLNDILYRASQTAAADGACPPDSNGEDCDSQKLRERCLSKSFVDEIRSWTGE